MYDAKKDENITKKRLQFECICDRNYYYMCKHSNMLDMRVSSIPVEPIIPEFK